MSVNVVVDGVTYIVPQQGDNYPWAAGQGATPGLTALFQALAAQAAVIVTATSSDTPGAIVLRDGTGSASGTFISPQDVRYYGATGNGSTDDTVAIQAAIDANKGGVVVFPTGTYLHAGVFLLGNTYDNTTLVGLGGELKLKADGGSSNFNSSWVGIAVQVASGVTMSGLRFNGNRTAMTNTEHMYCLSLAGVSNFTMPVGDFREIRGDGIYLSTASGGGSGNSSNVVLGTINAFNTADDGRNAVSVISCAGLTIGTLNSYQIGTGVNDGSGAGAVEPGGLDIEPDFGTHRVTDVSIGAVNVVTAGSGGFQIVGKSIGGADADDWNVTNVRVGSASITRTGYISRASLYRCSDVTVNADMRRSDAYLGGCWDLDYCNRVRGTLKASHCNIGVAVGTTHGVKDSDLRLEVDDYSTKGVTVSNATNVRFTGRVSNSVVVSASTPFAIHTTNVSQSGATQTNVVYSIDAPYDGVAVRGFRNEPNRPVSYTNCEIRDCDLSGYGFATMLDNSKAPAWVGATPYVVGVAASNNGLTYICATAGTSAGSGGPTGTGSGIVDGVGTLTWNYLYPTVENAWAQTTTYALNAVVSNYGNIYEVTTNGTSASAGNGPSSTGGAISDGTVVWKYMGALVATSPMRRNVRGMDSATGAPGGYFSQGEFVANYGAAHPVISSGGALLLGYTRVTNGTGSVAGQDWAPCYTLLSLTQGQYTPTNGGTVAPDLTLSGQVLVTYGAAVASATINSPLHPLSAAYMYFTIVNGSGGTITTTWDATGAGGSSGYSLASAWVDPVNGAQKSILFRWDTTTGKWFELWRGNPDLSEMTGTLATAQIAAHAVTNAKAAQMAGSTIKGNATGGTADAADLVGYQVRALTVGQSSDQSPANGGTVSPDLQVAQYWNINCANGVSAITIAAPANPVADQLLEITIYNNSGGGLTTTWNAAFLLAGGTWTEAADTKSRSVGFRYSSVQTKWRELWRSSNNV